MIRLRTKAVSPANKAGVFFGPLNKRFHWSQAFYVLCLPSSLTGAVALSVGLAEIPKLEFVFRSNGPGWLKYLCTIRCNWLNFNNGTPLFCICALPRYEQETRLTEKRISFEDKFSSATTRYDFSYPADIFFVFYLGGTFCSNCTHHISVELKLVRPSSTKFVRWIGCITRSPSNS